MGWMWWMGWMWQLRLLMLLARLPVPGKIKQKYIFFRQQPFYVCNGMREDILTFSP